jgi:hypothetical protein
MAVEEQQIDPWRAHGEVLVRGSMLKVMGCFEGEKRYIRKPDLRDI